MSSSTYGYIFLSHASVDKPFVESIYNKLDASNTFYDIKSVYPGQTFDTAMKDGIGGRNVFVLFHSPNTRDTWVEYEKRLAELNYTMNGGKVLVVPMGGETYRSLPDWMKSFMTCTEDFSVADIARQIIFLQNEIATQAGFDDEIIIGREDICQNIHLRTLKNLQTNGFPLQHIILSGLPGMGRSCIARFLTRNTIKSMRPAGPVFQLPDMAEAVDFYLAIRQDIRGPISKPEIEEHIAKFALLDARDQANTILLLVKHWADTNQSVLFKTRWGLRDRSRQMKEWFLHFVDLSKSVPSLRIIYVSERRLPDDTVHSIPNLAQFQVSELSEQSIQFALSELIDARLYNATKAEALTRHIHGHPATAHYTAKLVNAGRNLDTLDAEPGEIYAFQDRLIGEIISSDMIGEDKRNIIALLGVFPRLSFDLISRILEISRKQLARDLWELQESSLLSSSGSEYYTCPAVVAARSRKELSHISLKLVDEVRVLIEMDITNGHLDSTLIDSLLIASAHEDGKISASLTGLVTSSSLFSLVIDRFYRARDLAKGAKDMYMSAYRLSKIALDMKSSDDSVEQILFTGGDSAIRAGEYPGDIIARMTDAALPSVYYLKGSYAFHVKKDDREAVENLKIALNLKHFRLRNTRLLARALIRRQDFLGALEVIDKLPDSQVQREVGLTIQKIRALRGVRRFGEANALEQRILGRDDEYGEIHAYHAGKALREGRLNDALSYLCRAEESPKANRFNHQLLRCAVLIEKGDASMLPQMVETANSVNRKYDAHQLQARHAVVQGRWSDAENHLRMIDKKDFFDLQIEIRMLDLKMADSQIRSDAVALNGCRQRKEDVIRLSASSPEGYRDA